MTVRQGNDLELVKTLVLADQLKCQLKGFARIFSLKLIDWNLVRFIDNDILNDSLL